MQMPQGNPLLLPHTLQELLARDSVQVELIPEKKGLFLKHVEYQVSSQVAVRGGGRALGLRGGRRRGRRRAGRPRVSRRSCADAAAGGSFGRDPDPWCTHSACFFHI